MGWRGREGRADRAPPALAALCEIWHVAATRCAVDTKGIQLVRRDSCPLVKEVSTKVLDAIMYNKNTDAALVAARSCIAGVLRDEYGLDKFVVSKALRGDYKNTKQPHLYVAKKIAARRGYPVPSGSRVAYVFVEDLSKPDCLQAERAEDPEYAAEHGMPLDRLYYVDHQLKSPILALLTVLVPDPEAAVFAHDDVKPLLQLFQKRQSDALRVTKRLRKNAAKGQLEITTFFGSGASGASGGSAAVPDSGSNAVPTA